MNKSLKIFGLLLVFAMGLFTMSCSDSDDKDDDDVLVGKYTYSSFDFDLEYDTDTISLIINDIILEALPEEWKEELDIKIPVKELVKTVITEGRVVLKNSIDTLEFMDNGKFLIELDAAIDTINGAYKIEKNSYVTLTPDKKYLDLLKEELEFDLGISNITLKYNLTGQNLELILEKDYFKSLLDGVYKNTNVQAKIKELVEKALEENENIPSMVTYDVVKEVIEVNFKQILDMKKFEAKLTLKKK